VLLKSHLDVKQSSLRGQFDEPKLMFSSSLGVTKYTKDKDMIWVTNTEFGLRLFNKLASKLRNMFNNFVAFSATHISTTKSLKSVVNTKLFFSRK
jgi:hypothetical protein